MLFCSALTKALARRVPYSDAAFKSLLHDSPRLGLVFLHNSATKQLTMLAATSAQVMGKCIFETHIHICFTICDLRFTICAPCLSGFAPHV